MLTDDELGHLAALEAAATAGPWCTEWDGHEVSSVWEEQGAMPLFREVPRFDAEFIAALRNALPELLAEVQRLRSENEDHTKLIDAMEAQRQGSEEETKRHFENIDALLKWVNETARENARLAAELQRLRRLVHVEPQESYGEDANGL